MTRIFNKNLKTSKIAFNILILAGVVLIFACDAGKKATEFKTTKAGDFTLTLASEGKEITLSQLVKEKPVMLVFWTTWCVNCKKEIPEINSILDKYADKLYVLGVNIAEERELVLKFKEKYQHRYDSLLDIDSKVAQQFQVLGVPTIIIIGSDMNIKYNKHSLPKDINQYL